MTISNGSRHKAEFRIRIQIKMLAESTITIVHKNKFNIMTDDHEQLQKAAFETDPDKDPDPDQVFIFTRSHKNKGSGSITD